ncbi:hypothetical protein [Mucilaginibacter pedocola]|uniref:Uncharacterized protein n=1 Tax=Mucilaginibacter pedocola TaxID=1792845 RepID=A0A1S9P8X8_9SPHI|nr:hypothetical protein [Mucilaginibacter pedocola]OOQ57411.1 hypothetical protein BC343_15040 [Mucilaginibacter pedocola]
MSAIQISFASLFISLISLMVAIVLAWIRVVEYRRDNRSLQVSYTMSYYPDEWNIIYLTNISSKPILIDYWDVVWVKRQGLFRYKYEGVLSRNNEDLHVNLPPHSRKQFDFKDQYEFDWNSHKHEGEALFLELRISGKKKPLYLFVYKPN